MVNFSELAASTFVEVSLTVNTSGQIVAREVDAEEPTSTTSQTSAFLGRILNVTRGAGNALTFTLLVDDEIPDLSNVIRSIPPSM